MQIIVLQDNLEKSLQALSRVVSQKAQLPILSNILVSASKGELVLSATNLNESITITTRAKVEEEGQTTVVGKLFTEFVHLLPPKPVTLQVKGQSLHVSCDNIEADFGIIPATEFPKLPVFTEPALFTVQPKMLESIVSEVTFAASKDEGRPVLTGALLKVESDSFVLVATDGFRLSLGKQPFNAQGSEQAMLVPAKTLEELVRLSKEFAKGANDTIAISLLEGQNQIVARINQLDFSSRLLEGPFPDFEKVIPKDLSTTVTARRDDLLHAVRLASVFSRDGLSVVKMMVTTDGIVLTSDAKEVGSDVIKIDAQVEGEGGEIAFNPRFLLEFLQTVSATDIVMHMSGPLSPAMFRKDTDESYLHVIMPVRT